ncbi:hypothetical protein MK805_11045 [Shimazuella sp. AN120528]|uniref:hypothetical protein n=1 Tax=Shimazuella soli TaxID=1892854 RepID=UPI001F105C47|nr:hypothetical protein [Shimazuella soli]MCH5585488.1 hypothetical protein [Shimazuella soli]
MKHIKVSLIGTFVFVNLVLILFLWERNAVHIESDVPSIAEVNTPTTRSEIISEKVKTTKQGDYIVEDYEAIEVWYDRKGKEIKRSPTGDHTYLRYWNSKKGKVIIDDQGE